MAANVLMLNSTVPGNWIAAPNQSTVAGSQARGRKGCLAPRGLRRCGSWAAVTSWSSEALVKQIEPQKKVTPIHAADESSAASAGTRNIIDPDANRNAIHHAARSGRHHVPGRTPAERPAAAVKESRSG